jgi:outer membrane protein assembly factor BamB
MTAAGLSIVLLAGGLAFGWRLAHQRTSDVHRGTSLPYSLTSDPTTTVTSTGSGKPTALGPAWPVYGRTMARTRDATDLVGIKPPYRVVWKRSTGFNEYPPSYAHGVLYLYSNSGWLTAYRIKDGTTIWRQHTASSENKGLGEPAVDHGVVYVGSRANYVYAFSASTGRKLWSRNVGAPMESSPAFDSRYLYMSDLDGHVRALDLKSGRVAWTFSASGAVKHGPALVDGRLYFGDYSGVMYCLQASNGRPIWKTATHGLASGFSAGQFYSTPAVAYGRVYIGNTDGKVYSFEASNGQIAWTHTLPWWAYGSPAVSNGRVFATSADGTFVALNARTGSVQWLHKLPYHSLASPVVVGPLVYVADRGPSGHAHGNVYAFNPGSGRRVWVFHDGKYGSVIGANGDLVLAGVTHLYVLASK